MLFLRVERAALELGVPLVDLAPVDARAVAVRDAPRRRARCPARRSVRTSSTRSRSARGDRAGPVVVVLGRASLAESTDGDGAVRGRARRPRPTCASCPALRRGNVHGALDAGLAPGFLPGRVTLDDGTRVVRRRSGASRPADARARRDGHPRAPRPTARSQVLVLLGADPVADFPDADLARARYRRRGLRDRGRRVRLRRRRGAPTCSCRARCGARRPARSRTSKAACSGSAARSRPRARRWTTGASRPSSRSGSAPTSTSRPSTRSPTRSRAVAPAHSARPPTLLRRARDGVVLPLREHLDEIVRAHARPVDHGRRRPGHVVGSDQGRGRGARRPAEVVERRGTDADADATPRRAADGDDGSRREADAATRRAAGPRCPGATSGTATSRKASRRRATRTLCASWSAAQLYDGGRIVDRDARVRRDSRPIPRCGSTRTTSPRSASSRGTEVRITSARGTLEHPGRAPTPRVPVGVAVMPFLADGAGPRAARSTSTRAVTDLRVETLAVSAACSRSTRCSTAATSRGRCSPSSLIKVVVAFVLLLVSVMLYIWGMRKVIADMQNRIGPNRAGPYGVLQTLADGIKLFFKEQSIPSIGRPAGVPARAVPVDPARVPDVLHRSRSAARCRSSGTRPILQVADLPIGALWILAMSGIGVYGDDARRVGVGLEVPAARLGARDRAAAVVRSRVRARGARRADPGGHAVDARDRRPAVVGRMADSFFTEWYWLPAIVPFVIFLIAATAETNHPPFDLVEAEQELVGGFNTEYTGIRFAIFFLAEFMNVITMSAVAVTLFLGGPSGPGARLPRRRELRQRLAHAGVLVHGQGARCSCSAPCGCARRCRACATTS